MVGNIFGDNCTGTHHCTAPDRDSRKNSGIRPERCAMMNRRFCVFLGMLLGARKRIIGEGDVWADEYIIRNANAVPDLNSAFHGNAVAYNHIVFDKNMGANITSGSDPGVRQNDAELPNACFSADMR